MTNVTVLCSDGPHHLYLVNALLQAFGKVRVIVEPGQQQTRRHLLRKAWRPYLWSVYHDVRRQLLGYSQYRQQYFTPKPGSAAQPASQSWRTWEMLATTPGVTLLTTPWINETAVVTELQRARADAYIVMGTKKIGAEVLAAIPPDRILNIHGGHLPEYKGNHCFFFALKHGDVDKLSTTIHRVASGLDTGDIVMRCPVRYEEGDNSETLYSRAEKRAVDTLVGRLKADADVARWNSTRQEAGGTVYRMKDRGPLIELSHRLGMRKRRLQLAAGKH